MTFPVGDLTLDQLLEIKASIDAEIKTRLQDELSALDQRRAELLALAGIETANIAPAKPAKETRIFAVAKYRDPDTGKTWSGKGKRPRWFAVDRADDFLITA